MPAVVGELVHRPPNGAGSSRCLNGLAQHIAGDIEVYTAGPPGGRGANGARDAAPDVLDLADPIRRLHERSSGVELVEVLIVAALQVDHRPAARSGDLDHREAVRGGVRQRGQAVEKAGAGRRQTHAGPCGEEPRGGRRIAR